MKLYIWKEVFSDWTDGIAFAMANSKEEAIELIVKNVWWNESTTHAYLDNKEPEIYETPYGFAIWGGG